MSNSKDPHQQPYSFYDEVSGKYDYSRTRKKSEKHDYRGVYRVYNELIDILDYIRKESGFNTNAPDSRYNKARELVDELEGKIDKTKDPEENQALIGRLKWVLFQKLDHMEAMQTLKRMRF